MTALWTIVTPSVGRRSILKLKESLAKETVPYVHLIMMDSKRDPDALTAADLEDSRTFVYDIRHPLNPPSRARMDVYLRGVGLMMARTPFVRCCDDDAWPEPGHLSTVTDYMNANELDYTWCLRRMLTRSGSVIGIDRFEAIGYTNKFGYNLLDNSSLFFRTAAAQLAAQVFVNNPIYGDDRLTWEPLQQFFRGQMLEKVLTNHMAQPDLENFFREHCTPE